MAKTILLIESDAAFAREASSVLEGRGLAVRVTADGKEGLDVARDLRPDAIVLCVELPRMSGYSVCNKLKKDDALKSIPLVIISAEATPETFEQHRKLKTRAEDYLIKPFSPETLAERLGALVGLPATPASEEEVVTLADVEFEEAGPGNPLAPAGKADEDDDLRLLDDAFDSIARVDGPEETIAPEPPEEASAELLEVAGDAPPAPVDEGSGDGAGDLGALAEESAGAEELAASDLLQPAGEAPAEPPPPADLEPASADLLRAVGIPFFEGEGAGGPEEVRLEPDDGSGAEGAVPPLEEVHQALEERDAEFRALREELGRALSVAEQATEEGKTRESELRAARARLEAVQGSVRRLETDLKASREDARRAQERAAALEKDLAAQRLRLEEAEQLASQRGAEVAEALARAESLERSLEEARVEVSVSRNEAGALRGEADRRTSDLKRRVQELEGQTARHEERVVKAYQKIKSDEKLKEKTRKALAIALQLLDERLPVEGSGDPAGGPERPAS